jgi:hypothetical protein
MPARLRLDALRSVEVSVARLSPRYGCGLMLAGIPEIDSPDPLVNAMGNYGLTKLHADKPAKKHLENPGLLKPFFDNAFTHKTPLKTNFRQVFGHLEVYLAFDQQTRTVWFVADPHNRMALVNYFRDAVSLGLKSSGILLIGSTVRLTPVGWQNLYDLLSDKFINDHPGIQRVEVMTVLSGVRWRQNCMGLGVTLLNFRELADIQSMVEDAFAGKGGGEVQE